MNLLILIENRKIKKWHLNCIKEIEKKFNKIIILNYNYKKKYDWSKILYYLIKTISNPNTEKNFFNQMIGNFKFYDQEIFYNNKFFKLDQSFDNICKKNRVDIVLRFGLGIIKTNSKIPILSFHHGDPSKYRGRPSGFYELYNSEKMMGQIVQIISSNLDGGKILAYGESKVEPNSYSKTLENSYSISHILLKKALHRIKKKEFIKKSKNGKIYFLPSNTKVLLLTVKLFFRSLNIILLKFFYIKKWKIAVIQYKKKFQFNIIKKFFSKKKEIYISPNYNFIADPFFLKNNLIFEITKKFSQKGKIAIFNNKKISLIKSNSQHISFPSTFNLKGKNKDLIFPEIASWSTPKLFELRDQKLKIFKNIKIKDNKRILDPILFFKNKIYYIFGNDIKYPNILCLWIAKKLDDKFYPHPSSPVRLSPNGSRMAGKIIELNGKLFRVGQNNELFYGNGLVFFKIDKINAKEFVESYYTSLNLSKFKGPHTFSLNEKNKEFALDYYENKFEIFALLKKINPFH